MPVLSWACCRHPASVYRRTQWAGAVAHARASKLLLVDLALAQKGLLITLQGPTQNQRQKETCPGQVLLQGTGSQQQVLLIDLVSMTQ